VVESELKFLLQNRQYIPEHIKVVSPQNRTALDCLDKIHSYEIAKKCDIPLPNTKLLCETVDLQNFLIDKDMKVIVKPLNSQLLIEGEKCIFIESSIDLVNIEKELLLKSSKFIAQERIYGKRHNCQFAARNGKVIQYFESVVYRTTKLNYTGYSVLDESILATKEHVQWVNKFVKETNYSGIGCIQFLRDSAMQKSYFLEINPRIDATVALAIHCGINFPLMALLIALDNNQSNENEHITLNDYGFYSIEASLLKREYKIGHLRQWFYGDIMVLIDSIQSKELKGQDFWKYLLSVFYYFITVNKHTIWSWRDPKPAIVFYYRIIRNKALKLLRL